MENMKDQDPRVEPETASVEAPYEWVITTECVTHDAKELQDWRDQRHKFQDMGLDDNEVERPQPKAKAYQFHIGEVESIVQYNDENFGEIVVINKYNGNQVPIIEKFDVIAKIHKNYNKYRDQILEDVSRYER